jgi:hypothetical protein
VLSFKSSLVGQVYNSIGLGIEWSWCALYGIRFIHISLFLMKTIALGCILDAVFYLIHTKGQIKWAYYAIHYMLHGFQMHWFDMC